MQTPNNIELQIIMANQPRMLREMLGKILSRHTHVNVIGEVLVTSRLPLIIEVFHPDWIVLTLRRNGAFPDIADVLIADYPETGILAIDACGEQARARYGDLVFDGLALDELVDLLSKRDATLSIC